MPGDLNPKRLREVCYLCQLYMYRFFREERHSYCGIIQWDRKRDDIFFTLPAPEGCPMILELTVLGQTKRDCLQCQDLKSNEG